MSEEAKNTEEKGVVAVMLRLPQEMGQRVDGIAAASGGISRTATTMLLVEEGLNALARTGELKVQRSVMLRLPEVVAEAGEETAA